MNTFTPLKACGAEVFHSLIYVVKQILWIKPVRQILAHACHITQ